MGKGDKHIRLQTSAELSALFPCGLPYESPRVFLKLTHEDTNVFKSLHHNQRALLPQFLMISKQFLEIIN